MKIKWIINRSTINKLWSKENNSNDKIFRNLMILLPHLRILRILNLIQTVKVLYHKITTNYKFLKNLQKCHSKKKMTFLERTGIIQLYKLNINPTKK